jgi:uracil phosphoribosyltransferase
MSQRPNLTRNRVSATKHDPNVKVAQHPLLVAKLSILRARTTMPDEFRRNVQEMSILLVAEAARAWETAPIEIETPLKKSVGEILRRPVVIVPILRAGLGMLEGMLKLVPEASVGHIGLYRDEETLRPVTYFCRLPVNVTEAQVVLVDPMLATGHSASEAVSLLKGQSAKRIQFVCLLACPPGIEQLRSSHPDVPIITAAIDPELNDRGYIVPGLGDAGDRYFGTG